MKSIFITALLVLSLSFQLFSQDNVNKDNDKEPILWIGPFAGLNYNYHFLNFGSLPPFPNCCPEFESATGFGFTLGALVDVKLLEGIYLDTRIGLSDIGANMTTVEYIGGTFIKSGTNPPMLIDTFATSDYNINTKLMHFNLEPTLEMRFFDNFALNVGAKFAYLFISRFSQEEVLKQPDNVTFLDGTRTRNKYSNELIPDVNSFQIFGVIGVSYSLPVAKDMYLQPEIRYNIPFMDISNAPTQATDYWKASSFQFGAALKIPIYPPEPPPKIDTVFRQIFKQDTQLIVEQNIEERIDYIDSDTEFVEDLDEEAHILYLTEMITEHYIKYEREIIGFDVALETVGIDKDGLRNENSAKITIEELEVEEGFPLLTHVFFPMGSSNIYKSKLKLLKPEQVNDFNQDSLEWNTMHIYLNMLNIIGYRMKKYPKSTITITGCNNNQTEDEKGNLKLSIARANVVKDYLVGTWKIEPPRIKIRRRNLPANPGNSDYADGVEENQRAEISSDNFEIIKPLFLSHITRNANPPQIVFYPKVNSEAGLKNWELSVDQSGNQLRKYTGAGEVNDSLIWWVEPDPIPKTEDDVLINFTAYDLKGQKTAVTDTFKIVQETIKKKIYEQKNDKIIQNYSLILFDYDKAELTTAQKKTLDKIIKEITPESKVTISGYTDRTGEKDYNKELARRRAEETKKRLMVNGAVYSINPVGSDELIYDNNTAQGRSYCRTVKIRIETPINR